MSDTKPSVSCSNCFNYRKGYCLIHQEAKDHDDACSSWQSTGDGGQQASQWFARMREVVEGGVSVMTVNSNASEGNVALAMAIVGDHTLVNQPLAPKADFRLGGAVRRPVAAV
jgi:hypothetical protein